jgi:hypothetical protein
MSILTGDNYIGSAKQYIPYTKTTAVTAVALQMFSMLDVAGNPSAGSLAVGNTANGLVPTDATAGFPLINAFGGSAKGYLSRISFSGTVACRYQIWDRLFHVGSISLTTLATTTLASQPSYSGRLPNTDYKGLFIIIEINVAVSATATTVAITYTNQDGTTGRATGATASLSGFTTRRLIIMPLQAGDTGVQKIESVIVGGTVATTGTVNVIVARMLAENLRVKLAGDGDTFGLDRTGLPEIFADSALWVTCTPDSTSTGVPDLLLEVANN